MTARSGCYSLAGLVGSLVAAVTNYAAGDTTQTSDRDRIAARAALAGEQSRIVEDAAVKVPPASTAALKPKEQR